MKPNKARDQLDLFSQDPERMHWQNLPKTVREECSYLLGQFLFSLIGNSQTKEPSDARKDHS
jgi:hypothetical protein